MRIHQPPKRPVTRLADVPMGGVFRLHETDFRFFMITKAGIIDLANGEIRDPETFAASADDENDLFCRWLLEIRDPETFAASADDENDDE